MAEVIEGSLEELFEGEYLDGASVLSEAGVFPGSSRPVTNADGNLTDLQVPIGVSSVAIENVERQNNNTYSEYTNDGLWPEYCNPSYKMPDEIEVKVKLAGGDFYFPVQIVKADMNKTYLGGYRNKRTGALYHHASSQTPPTVMKRNSTVKDNSNLRSRDTQTYEQRTLSVQPYRESGTQMERIDLRLDNKRDITLTPRPYFTSEELYELKLAKCIFIQRCWRGYMARCYAQRLVERNRNYEKSRLELVEKKLLEDKLRREADMERRLHPQSNSDFATLYNELDAWRKAEILRVKSSTAPGEERAKALAEVLSDETKALQAIQKLKIAAQKKLQSDKTVQMLEQMAQPYKWQLSSGDVAFVQTPSTNRSKELRDLYLALQANLTTDERLDILLHVKWCVKEFESPLTRDISDLIDREADLLNRGRPAKSMEKHKVRLNNLFLQFIENPIYNPRAKDFISFKKPEETN